MEKKYIAVALLSLGTIADTAAQEKCELKIEAEYGCIATGEGWGVISLVENGLPPYTMLWSNGAMTQYTEGLPDGPAWVTLTDANGCSSTYNFESNCTKKEDCRFTTFTQGGWGAPPNGNNPGAYLHANFASCFPNGVTIGCDRTLRLTTAAAVTAFLPSGSTPKKLLSNYVNPGSGYNNVLAGQLVAATLSVQFDACNAAFGESDGWLGDAIIATGTFEGWTVSELLDEANAFIGNCPSSYTATQFNAALTSINENFDNGNTDGGFLICQKQEGGEEGGGKSVQAPGASSLKMYPNPASGTFTVQLDATIDGVAQVVLLDLSGREVKDLGKVAVENGLRTNLVIDVQDVTAGLYVVNVRLNDEVLSRRLTVTK
jgi:hypothetical protein